jgi:hypothetical protein
VIVISIIFKESSTDMGLDATWDDQGLLRSCKDKRLAALRRDSERLAKEPENKEEKQFPESAK